MPVDDEGYTCVAVDGGWLVVDRYGHDEGQSFEDYRDARASAELRNEAVLAARFKSH